MNPEIVTENDETNEGGASEKGGFWYDPECKCIFCEGIRASSQEDE